MQLLIAGLAGLLPGGAGAQQSASDMTGIYRSTVDRRLEPPAAEVRRYARLIIDALKHFGASNLADQYLVLVDRSPLVQAVFVYWMPAGELPQLVGASPASTGRPGSYDHFQTPTGLFAHSLANPDFRAEGTRNSKGILGYGVRGMRVFDFGWQSVPKGWGDRKVITMRLQMHATDPDLLEPRLGTAQSKGCIRIPAALNHLIDHYGLIDADYERAVRDGKVLWVLQPDRQPTQWPGRYLLVVDTQRTARPEWAKPPRLPPSRTAPARAHRQPTGETDHVC